MSQPNDLAYDISVCVHSADIPTESVAIWGEQPIGLRPLRRLPSGKRRSGRRPIGCSPQIATLSVGMSAECTQTEMS